MVKNITEFTKLFRKHRDMVDKPWDTLSEESGLTATLINGWMTGRIKPSCDTGKLNGLCEALELSKEDAEEFKLHASIDYGRLPVCEKENGKMASILLKAVFPEAEIKTKINKNNQTVITIGVKNG